MEPSAASVRQSRALILHGPKDLRLEYREVPFPQAGEVQISVRATGICGSDLHYYHQGRNGDFIVRAPLCLGHESVGTVTGLGPEVTTLQVGDRVALEVGLPCSKCSRCLQGRYNLCRKLRFRSSAGVFPHLDGTLMDVTNHPAMMCHKLPPSISDVQGALLEPLAVCLHAIHRSNPPTEREVNIAKSIEGDGQEETAALIFGAGAIGLLLVSALATTTSFTTLVVVDRDQARLDIVASLPFASGRIRTIILPNTTPSSVLPIESSSSPTDKDVQGNEAAKALANKILNTCNFPYGFSRVYDCTGAAHCVRAAIHASSPGGAVVQIGMGGASLPSMPMAAAALREVDLVGVLRYDGRCYPDAVVLMGSGALDGVAELVVTHRVGLGEDGGQKAFELAGSGKDSEGKPVVKVVVMGE